MNRLSTVSLFLSAFTVLSGAGTASLNAQSTRTVLLETSESNWSHTNSTVICAKEEAKSEFGNSLAVIAYHWDDIQNGGDPMYQLFADQWAQTYNVSQWGRGAIDRVSFNGTTMTSLNTSLWIDTIASRINRPTDALVTLPEVLYDPNYNEIFVRVQMDVSVSSIDNRELRFFCFLVQDGFIADQLVDTLELGGCSLFADTLDTAVNFSHNDVAVTNPSGYAGTDNIIPLQVTAGNRFHSVYTFAKPSGVSIDDLRVVAFVANYDNGDVTGNRVLNAAQKADFTEYDSDDETDANHPLNPENPNSQYNQSNWPTGVEEVEVGSSASVYPNPVNGLGIIEYEVPSAQMVEVTLYDLQGRPAMTIYKQQLGAGPQRAAFNSEGLAAGHYVARVQGVNFVAQCPVVVVQ